jgi:hypothetical protein
MSAAVAPVERGGEASGGAIAPIESKTFFGAPIGVRLRPNSHPPQVTQRSGGATLRMDQQIDNTRQP